MSGEPEQPVFDDSRKALVFALNEGTVEMPRPFMNKAMAVGPRKGGKKAPKRARKAAGVKTEALALLEEENAPKARKSSNRPRPLGGLDRPHQAGFILQQLNRLDQKHVIVLKGLLIRAYEPCACRAPCCSGWRRNARWALAVTATCLLLQGIGDVLRQPGKRGLSTQPEMRLAFVEQFFTKNTMSMSDAAAIGHVSLVTAAKHKEWITAYLAQVETEAWLQVDAIFDQVGITGSFEEVVSQRKETT